MYLSHESTWKYFMNQRWVECLTVSYSISHALKVWQVIYLTNHCQGISPQTGWGWNPPLLWMKPWHYSQLGMMYAFKVSTKAPPNGHMCLALPIVASSHKPIHTQTRKGKDCELAYLCHKYRQGKKLKHWSWKINFQFRDDLSFMVIFSASILGEWLRNVIQLIAERLVQRNIPKVSCILKKKFYLP